MPRTKPTSLSDELFGKLQARIIKGAMPPGSRFPTQKEIAATEQVSRTVVREAVARLAAQGLTRSRQGSGVFVAETIPYQAFQITRDEMTQLEDVIKLLEMRLPVEADIARLAAMRRSTEDVKAIEGYLRKMADSVDFDASVKADAGFHAAIARATRNEYFERFVEFLGVRLIPSRTVYLKEQDSAAHLSYAKKIHAEHQAIFDAIARRDPAAAQRAARRHMEGSLKRHAQLAKRSKVSD